jgi:RimJ/RimL family protein N-acetyltransferase
LSPRSPAAAEVGGTFARAHHGSGLATEALAAVITDMFLKHRLHRLYAKADNRNLAV